MWIRVQLNLLEISATWMNSNKFISFHLRMFTLEINFIWFHYICEPEQRCCPSFNVYLIQSLRSFERSCKRVKGLPFKIGGCRLKIIQKGFDSFWDTGLRPSSFRSFGLNPKPSSTFHLFHWLSKRAIQFVAYLASTAHPSSSIQETSWIRGVFPKMIDFMPKLFQSEDKERKRLGLAGWLAGWWNGVRVMTIN